MNNDHCGNIYDLYHNDKELYNLFMKRLEESGSWKAQRQVLKIKETLGLI